MAILVSVIRFLPGFGISPQHSAGFGKRCYPGSGIRQSLGADAGWIEKENDIQDIDEISSGRMPNSSAKEAGIRDQEPPPPPPPFQALFYVGIPPDETEPWLCFDRDEYLDTWRK